MGEIGLRRASTVRPYAPELLDVAVTLISEKFAAESLCLASAIRRAERTHRGGPGRGLASSASSYL